MYKLKTLAKVISFRGFCCLWRKNRLKETKRIWKEIQPKSSWGNFVASACGVFKNDSEKIEFSP
jgi:hypothetical protein